MHAQRQQSHGQKRKQIDRLREVLRLYKARRGSATGSTRDFYDYQILLIERLFAN